MRRKKAKKQGHYCLVYDREGRCTWETPTSAMNGVPMQIVEVVTKADRKEYLVQCFFDNHILFSSIFL